MVGVALWALSGIRVVEAGMMTAGEWGGGEYLEAEPCLRPSPRASWEGQGLLDHLGSGLDCTCEYQQV